MKTQTNKIWLTSLIIGGAAIALSACGEKAEETAAVADEVEAAEPEAGDADAPEATAKATSYAGIDFPPVFNAADELVQPVDFRQWIFIGSPLTPNGLNAGAANFPEYHNVYVQPAAFDHYRATGTWLEGTMMVKELQLVKGGGEFEDGSRFEVSGRGYFPAEVNGMDVAVKDSSRYGDSDNWGYFNFGHHAAPYAASAAAMPIGACAQCHIDNAHEDMVYVEFYADILKPLPTE